MLMRFCFAVLGLWMACAQSVTAATVSLDSLLGEMTDRTALAQFPDPAYTCTQASSYDPKSVSADQPGWFANGDRSQFIREETNDGRTEWVMMDAKGPGAIVRFYSSNLAGGRFQRRRRAVGD